MCYRCLYAHISIKKNLTKTSSKIPTSTTQNVYFNMQTYLLKLVQMSTKTNTY